MLISGKFYLYISAVHFLAQNSFAALFLYVHVYLSFTKHQAVQLLTLRSLIEMQVCAAIDFQERRHGLSGPLCSKVGEQQAGIHCPSDGFQDMFNWGILISQASSHTCDLIR
ncbi:uncharacterized protein LOC124695683 [Lolium rigidum]|uniref:uncharacterized protein LOC124695683 n=1 Tax=Lolium rigidum TaxID=89674 RepID=UPI001F5CEA7B|nr:uncharacterized protein LOC124695683 [Lolium rigidum]